MRSLFWTPVARSDAVTTVTCALLRHSIFTIISLRLATMSFVISRSIVDYYNKAVLFTCAVAMLFCWTQSIRSHYLSVRANAAVVADIIEWTAPYVPNPATVLRDAVLSGIARLRSHQPAERNREPVLPIAETIAARSGEFFPPRSSICVSYMRATSATAVREGSICE